MHTPAAPETERLFRKAWRAVGVHVLALFHNKKPSELPRDITDAERKLHTLAYRASECYELPTWSIEDIEKGVLEAEPLLQAYIDQQEERARTATRNAERARSLLTKLPGPVCGGLP